MKSNPWEIYDLLIAFAQSQVSEATVKQITLGLTWTLCHSGSSNNNFIGMAMSPGQFTRTLPWSGTLVNRPIKELVTWIKSWNPFEATLGLAAINSVINANAADLTNKATALMPSGSPNLAVFEHFLPRLKNKKVVVVGRYPGLDKYQSLLDISVLERNTIEGDFPDTACEYLLPEADWVFLTANSIVNKTFPRLAELSRNAVTVLMGPSVPWLEEWAEYSIDFLAGVLVNDQDSLQATVAQGGGVRIFDQAVQYSVLDLSQKSLLNLKTEIADMVISREQLKSEMEAWYEQRTDEKRRRFPKWHQLEYIDRELSLLDLKFKRQWDARH